MIMRRSCREGEINNAKKDNERTESKVHENAKGMRQKEARMGKQWFIDGWNDKGLSSHPVVHLAQWSHENHSCQQLCGVQIHQIDL